MTRKVSVRVIALLGAMLLLVGVRGADAGSSRGGRALAQPAYMQGQGNQPLVPVGTGFTYQGRLNDGGNPANGPHDFTFKLYDTAIGGNQVGSTISTTLTLADGLFTANLDFGVGAFEGEARWLEIAVRPSGGGGYTTLLPRQVLTAAPYAMSLRPGAVISGTTGTATLGLNNSGTGDGLLAIALGADAYGVHGTANNGQSAAGVLGSSSSGFGVRGESTALNREGVFGISNNGPTATGVFGSSTSGRGVLGYTTASNSQGVYGIANNGGGASGVYGFSSSGTGVYGHATGTPGAGVFGFSTGGTGVYAVSNAVGGYGVYGLSGSGSNSRGVYGVSNEGVGVYGTTAASNGQAVYGSANNGSNASGVYGTSTTGRGVYGITFAVDGEGVYGTANSGTSASGVYGVSSTGRGVWGNSTASGGYGVYGTANSGQTAVGVYGISSSGFGVRGESSALNREGVFGISNNGSSATGVYGSSTTGRGVLGFSTGGTGVEAAGNGTSTTALKITNGAIKVTGAGESTSTAVFVHVAHLGVNVCGDLFGDEYTVLDNPYANGDPNAILFVTARSSLSPAIRYNTGTIADCPTNRWLAYDSDFQDGWTENAKLNVMVIKP